MLVKCKSRLVYMQRSLVLDTGHLLVQVPKRSGILWKRIAHKEFGTISRKRCWWNSLKGGCPIFPCYDLNWPGGKLKSKGHGKLTILFVADQETIETIFRIIVSANQLSLYGAVANMCEECEFFHDRSGQLDKVMVQSIVLSEVKTEILLENDDPAFQKLSIAAIWRANWKAFTNKIKWVDFAWMQNSWVLLKLDSISWLRTLENNFMQWLVVNTLFQEMMDHQNQKGWIWWKHENWTRDGSNDQLPVW